MKHFRIKTRLFRRAALSLLTLFMAFTAQTAWAGYGWYDISMSIGGVTTNPNTWSGDPEHPTDLGFVSDMTVTSIAFKIWSDANDRGGANMYFRVYDDNGQVGTDQDIHLGTATRIAGDHDFSISWTDSEDLAAAVGLTLELGKDYYIDVWAKSYSNNNNNGSDEWYSNGGANYHAKLTYVPNGNCGTTDHESEVTWSLNSGGVLTISGTGAMADFDDSDSKAPWLSYKDNITSVVIENGVTSIGNFAFYECEYLASVSIPASVTSIGQGAYYHCGYFTDHLTVTIATGSSLTTIGKNAFQGAPLTSITIPASVTSIGDDAFNECEYLTTIDIPASVTSIGARAFHGCGNKVDAALTVTFASGSSLTTIGDNAFGETNLSSISIPASVTSIGQGAFYICKNLTTIDIPASVTSIGESAFSDCTNLTTITLHSNPFIGDNAFPDNATVTMNLTANSAGGAKWMTFYNKNYSFQADENTQVFKVELSDDSDELTMHEVGDKIVNKGIAVVLKKTSGNPVMTLTIDSSTNQDKNSLLGVAGPDVKTSDGTIYVLNHTKENGVGFYKLKKDLTLGVGKAYLTYNPDYGGSLTREFLGFGETTGINDVRCQKEDVRGEYYDLQGRRVSQPTKGLYIVNGKKVVIK